MKSYRDDVALVGAGLLFVALLVMYAFTTQISVFPSVSAQQKPYTVYAIPGGRLYITPQGYAVISQDAPVSVEGR